MVVDLDLVAELIGDHRKNLTGEWTWAAHGIWKIKIIYMRSDVNQVSVTVLYI